MKKAVGVIGMGSFGIAVANLISHNSDVLLYSRSREKIDDFNKTHTFRSINFNINVIGTCSLEEVANTCDLIFILIPSENLRGLMREFGPLLNPSKIIIHGIKGLDIESIDLYRPDLSRFNKNMIKTMSTVILEESSIIRVGALSGPNLAKEILAGQPTATVLASQFDEVIKLGQEKLSGDKFYVFGSKDVYGAEFAGVFKNVIAIGTGILAGKGLGKNIQAMLITRGLREMIILGKLLHAKKRAFLGTAGIGDLIATATSDLSRNFTFGKRLGQGESVNEVLESINEVVEGVRTLKIAYLLSRKYNLPTPIIYILYKVVFDGTNIDSALSYLMRYPYAEDVDFI
jgi:glycerol-3-phosphate dehydrogenase (NAD(P)+)